MSDLIARLTTAREGRYHVERELGAGGMATVYLARDVKHGRRVALKVISPELAATVGRERFLREIEIAATLNHPNVLGLLDSGDADGLLYYVMPFVEGESLGDRLAREGQLPLEDALRITRQVASALSYAHSLGIVHRDIKPGNILLSGEHTVVADFGIAKAVTDAGGDTLTETGLVVGTPTYMSPEQAAGRKGIDGRADIYSLGCVFYHMVVGEPPFTGPSVQAVLARHSVDPVSPLSTVRSTVPPGIDRAVTKAMAKVPADRYRTAQLFAEALDRAAQESPGGRPVRSGPSRIVRAVAIVLVLGLAGMGWWMTAGRTGAGIERLAVLPPTEPAGDPDQAPIVQGMYEALLTELGQAGVRVVGSVQSMMRYRNTEMTAREIAAELNVDALVESSVFWASDRVGIGVRLIDGRTEDLLWSQSYDADAGNVTGLYREVTRAIAGEIQVALTPTGEARLAETALVDPDAHEAYLKGRYYSGRFTPVDFETAIDYFERAIEIDSLYAPAWAGLSWVWTASRQMGFSPPSAATPQAVRTAERALELDSLLSEAHFALASARGWGNWEWDLGEREFRRAIELNPSNGDARADFSHTLLALRRFEESQAQIDTALMQDPQNGKFLAFRAVIWLATGWVEEARAEYARLARLMPDNTLFRMGLIAANHVVGRHDEVVQSLIDQYARRGVPGLADSLRHDYQTLAYPEAVRSAADRLVPFVEAGRVAPGFLEWHYAMAGAVDSTLAWLERALRNRDSGLPYIGVMPIYDFLQGEPRYQALLEALRLPWALDGG